MMDEESLLSQLRVTKSVDDILIDFQLLLDETKLHGGSNKLYNFLHEFIPTFSRRQLRSIFDRKVNIKVNGESMGSSDEYRRLNLGDMVSFRLSVREFLENTPEFMNMKIVYTDDSLCVIEKPSNINCVHLSLFEYCFRLKCWNGLYYESCDCLYRLPKHGSGLMLIASNVSVAQEMYSRFCINYDLNFIGMTCVTSSTHRPSVAPEKITDTGFDIIDSITIHAEQIIESRSYGFVSIIAVIPRLAQTVSVKLNEDLNKTRELFSLDLKRIKHVLKRHKLTIIGLDNVGKQGKGVFSVWNELSFLPLLALEVPLIPVKFTLPLPGKFEKFLEKENHYMNIQREKLNLLSTDSENYSNVSIEPHVLQRPIEYQTGVAQFCDLSFLVNENVLIPRPSSEQLVMAALKYADLLIAGRKNQLHPLHILDLGTGSGSLLISVVLKLRSRYPSLPVHGYGIDISEQALQVAEANAKILKCDDAVSFGVGTFEEPSTWCPITRDPFPGYDILICNPPYSAPSEKRRLALSSRLYEPEIAIFADNSDPLNAYRQLQKSLLYISVEIERKILSEQAYFITEVGAGQCRSVQEIFRFPFSNSWKHHSVEKDHKGFDRAIILFCGSQNYEV